MFYQVFLLTGGIHLFCYYTKVVFFLKCVGTGVGGWGGQGGEQLSYVFIQACTLVSMCAKVCVWVGQRSLLGIFFISFLTLFSREQGLSVNLELTDLANVTEQQALGILLCSPPHCQDYRHMPLCPDFLRGCQRSNLGLSQPLCQGSFLCCCCFCQGSLLKVTLQHWV